MIQSSRKDIAGQSPLHGGEHAVVRQVGALQRDIQALDAQVAEAERMLKLADPEVRWLCIEEQSSVILLTPHLICHLRPHSEHRLSVVIT